MSGLVRFDPELEDVLPLLTGVVPVGLELSDLARFREMTAPSKEEFLQDKEVAHSECVISGHEGGEITVSVIAPRNLVEPGPCILFFHGGGMIMGNRFSGAAPLLDWATRYGAVCVTPEYRLAPEFPAPTPVEDCYATLLWVAENAEQLLIDPTRIVIFGGSAGGGLAAGVVLLARDREGPKLLGQLLQCPMIDDRNDTVSARQFDGVGVWDTSSNQMAWRALLGEICGSENISPYSAPARVENLSGLPPTFVDVGAKEVFRDEAIAYAMGIMQAGGQCELHVWGDAFHGFYDIAPNTSVSQACLAARESWLERLLR